MGSPLTPIYRAPMRARDRDLRAGAGAEHGMAHVAGGQGRCPSTAPATLDEAVESATVADGAKAGWMLRRFAEVPEGSFVWTRDVRPRRAQLPAHARRRRAADRGAMGGGGSDAQ
jgi:hypothetical protein